MPDFNGLENELNSKGTKVVYELKHNEQVLSFVYDDILETKQAMDNLIQSYLTNFTITSTLESSKYKGDAVVENAII